MKLLANAQAQSDVSPFWRAAGVAALAFAIGAFAASAFDLHQHACVGCGRTWWHFGAWNVGDAAAHACPTCGRIEWWRADVPEVVRRAHEARITRALPERSAT